MIIYITNFWLQLSINPMTTFLTAYHLSSSVFCLCRSFCLCLSVCLVCLPVCLSLPLSFTHDNPQSPVSAIHICMSVVLSTGALDFTRVRFHSHRIKSFTPPEAIYYLPIAVQCGMDLGIPYPIFLEILAGLVLFRSCAGKTLGCGLNRNASHRLTCMNVCP